MTGGVTISGDSIFTASATAGIKVQRRSLFNHSIKIIPHYHHSEQQRIPLWETTWFYPFMNTAKLRCGTDVCRIGLYWLA